jgi:septal ring factor EnvC (AmiA/AmiB activator)
MAKEGINLSDMNVKLLKKVEELTLYLIKKDEQISDQTKQLSNQDKQITDQGKEIEQQQQVNQSLQAQINELARKLNK